MDRSFMHDADSTKGWKCCVQNVSQVQLALKHMVKTLPMFEPRMHAWCFQVIFPLIDCIANGELELCTERMQESPFSSQLPSPHLPRTPFQAVESSQILALELAKDQVFVICSVSANI